MEGGDGGLGLPNQALMAAYALHQDQQDESDRRSSVGSMCSAGSVGYWTATSGGGSSLAGSVHGGSARFSAAPLDAALRRGGPTGALLAAFAAACVRCPLPRQPARTSHARSPACPEPALPCSTRLPCTPCTCRQPDHVATRQLIAAAQPNQAVQLEAARGAHGCLACCAARCPAHGSASSSRGAASSCTSSTRGATSSRSLSSSSSTKGSARSICNPAGSGSRAAGRRSSCRVAAAMCPGTAAAQHQPDASRAVHAAAGAGGTAAPAVPAGRGS